MANSKLFSIPFGATGDRVVIPEATDPSGAVSYQQGFGPDYERDPATDPLAKRVPRDETNEYLYQITNALKWLQTFGAPEWYALDDAGVAVSYPVAAQVRHLDKNWVSLVAANTVQPGTDATKWAEIQLVPIVPAASMVTAFSNPGSFSYTVPAGVYRIEAEIWGGGGGGGYTADATRGLGGAAGGYVRAVLAVTPGQVVPVVVGAGGAGGTNAATAQTGGTSSVGGSSTQATGGVGGPFGNGGVWTGPAATGGAGTGPAGSLRISGRNGGGAFSVGTIPIGGWGAPAAFGTWAGFNANDNGFFPGGGGGGATPAGGTGAANGGNGAGGLVVIRTL